MTPDNWKLVLAFGGMFLATVTGPILWGLAATSKQFKADIATTEANIRTDMSRLEMRLNDGMAQMEKRLNDRIDARLVRR